MKKPNLSIMPILLLFLLLPSIAVAAGTPTGINPAVDIDLPNFANSPNLRKFVDSLPGLGSANANNLGQYIPVANPDQTTFSGADYYEIGLKQYQRRMHSDLPAAGTQLRGYYQKNNGNLEPTTDHAQQYLGPLIIARKDRPVRIKFYNELLPGADGNLPLPVDTKIMGAGMGPLGGMELYTQNRADLHLHGGFTPWISDGTPHQWITPAGDPTPYKKGASFQNVPDMFNGSGIPCIGGATCFTPASNDGIGTYYYPNQQSARLMFYHDHSYGITRLNVYAGEAAGYLLTDQVEEDLINRNILPNLGGVYRYGIPLIIQDRTFINDATTPNHAGFLATGAIPTEKTAVVDPLWYNYVPEKPGVPSGGNFWFPHEYLPNENIYDPLGYNVMGRWDYAPWMIPPMPVLNNTLPSPTLIPEAFLDTPIVNGAAFPYLELPPTAVRFRILNACNDRMLNLQLYKAEPLTVVLTDGGSGYTAPVVTFSAPQNGVTATGTAIAVNGVVTGITVTNPGSGYTSAPTVSISDSQGGSGTGATAYAAVGTEVKMVPASPNPDFPSTWPTDGRPGGVPDPATAGPIMYQIGNEAGLLAKVAAIPPQPVDYDYNRRSVTFGGVTSKALYLPPAVRADILLDLSQYQDGDTLILYNDAPAPMPLFDTRNDYFTADPDQIAMGGAPSTPAGFGPNTRTIMQIRIKGSQGTGIHPDLQTEIPKAFAAGQEAPLVPSSAFNEAYNTIYQDIYANSVDESLNITGIPQAVAKVVVEIPGSGYTTPPLVSFYGGGGTGAAATATLNGITGITLVTPGSGCTTPPNVIFSPVPGGGGTGANATAIVSGGVVTAVVINNPGSNYLLAPQVTFTGGCRTLPTATATVTRGSVGSINLTNAGSGYTSAPRVYLTGGGGTGAMAAAMLNGSLVLNGKNLVEGFDMEFGRMNAVLGSTPNPLAPAVGAGPIIGANFYVDPPTEIMKAGETVLWRLNHLGVDSHAIHFHLFDVQVVNRVDWTNTIKPPYDDEIGWKETIRTNPFEDIILAIRPKAMNLPFAIPDSVRLLDPTSPAGSTTAFQPVLPPPGVPAVAQITNVMTNFGWEYVWHCHLLGHEENDMMRPVVLQPGVPVATVVPTTVSFGNQVVGGTSAPRTITLTNGGAPGTQSLIVSGISITGTNAGLFAQTNTCSGGIAPGNSCTIGVTFSPTATGARSATLVIAGNAAGSPINIPLTGTGLSLPAAPTNLTATVTSVSQIGLSWRDMSSNETAFAVLRSTNGGGFVQIATIARSTTQSAATGVTVTYSDNAVAPGNSYTYQVTATNGAGASPSITATVNFSPPSAPSGLTANSAVTGVYYASVLLNWTDTSNNESGFTIQRSTDGVTWSSVTTTAANVTTYTQNYVVRKKTYQYRIRANNLLGSSPWVVVSVTTP